MAFKNTKNINGIILVDKPYGFSSNCILQIVKKILKVKKAGHTGSLDPIATGMLPICLGEATKISQFLINLSKRYRVIAKLGQRTSTSDSEGTILESRIVDFGLSTLKKILNNFRGNIQQIPPMYSALKYKGQALYKYARKGILISRNSRQVTIYKLDYIYHCNTFLELDVICSKGTYIRTLVEDLGEALNCGAHVISLCRLQVGNYPLARMVNINQLKTSIKFDFNFFSNFLDEQLISIKNSICFMPEINIATNVAIKFKQGQIIKIQEKNNKEFVRVTEGIEKHFIGIGKLNNINELRCYRLIKDS